MAVSSDRSQAGHTAIAVRKHANTRRAARRGTRRTARARAQDSRARLMMGEQQEARMAAAHAGESERPSRRDARVHARARGALSERALAACAPESGQTYSPWGGPARVAMRAARRARAARGPALAAAACAAAGLAATCAALEASSDDPATVVAAALASGPGSCALVTSLLVGDEIALTLPGGGGEAPFALANDALRELLCANRIPRAAPHDDKPAAQVRQAAARRRWRLLRATAARVCAPRRPHRRAVTTFVTRRYFRRRTAALLLGPLRGSTPSQHRTRPFCGYGAPPGRREPRGAPAPPQAVAQGGLRSVTDVTVPPLAPHRPCRA